MMRNSLKLVLSILVAYTPFLFMRVIRTTGDEKVYIAQALEMFSQKHYFLQVLHEQPDYYKGPFHYLFIQLGFFLFGKTIFAAVYMNLFFCIVGAVALSEIVRSCFTQQKHWPFFAGLFFASNVGIYGHLFASQMEVELAGLFTLAFYFLLKDRSKWDCLFFWIIAGLVGWIKSPLHSVFLGVSCILYGFFTKKTFHFWMSHSLGAGLGVLVCVSGYLPAWILDRENFVETYIFRENLRKAEGNASAWWDSLLPIFTYYLIPWSGVALWSYFSFFKKIKNFSKILSELFCHPAFCLGLAAFIPSALFFCFHPYHGENYNVPVTASVILIVLSLLYFDQSPRAFIRRNQFLGLCSFILLLVPLLLQIMISTFSDGFLFPSWFLPVLWIVSLTSVGLQVWEHFFIKADGLGFCSAFGNLCFVTVFSFILSVFGEIEVAPLKAKIKEDRAKGTTYSIGYYNPDRYIWNEAGLTSLTIGENIQSLYTEKDFLTFIKKGDLILARSDAQSEVLEKLAHSHFPELKAVRYPWPRWRTHGQDADGNFLIQKAWKEKSFKVLFEQALMVRFVQGRESQ